MSADARKLVLSPRRDAVARLKTCERGGEDGTRKGKALQVRARGRKKKIAMQERSSLAPAMRTILLIVLIILLIGAFPSWPYSTGWGYYPAGGIGLILLIVLILALVGRI